MEKWLEEWFTERPVTVLNVYVLALILVEHFSKNKNKREVEKALNYIATTLFFQGWIDYEQKEQLLDDLKEETETLSEIKELLFTFSKNPSWLQSQTQTVQSGGKILLARPINKTKTTFGSIK